MIDVDFYEVPCELLSLDISDVMGTNRYDILNNLHKKGSLKRFALDRNHDIISEYTMSEIPDITKVI